MELKNCVLKELESKCKVETVKYWKKQQYVMDFCFEIFRRAFEDRSDQALSALYDIYKPLVWYWVKNHPLLRVVDLPSEELVLDSMSQFVLAMRKNSFNHFPSIAKILSYLKRCVHTIITAAWRKSQKPALPLDEEHLADLSANPTKGMIAGDIWIRIGELLSDAEDRLLARLIFIQNLKPRQVVKDFPDIWATSNQVRVNQQKIKRCLQKDKQLRELLGE